jgi:dephospho-CoA kinase
MHVRKSSLSKKLIIGLIGGVGSGKSLAAKEFAKFGARVISGDELGHEALQQPNIKEQVLRHWGPKILNESGEVDRRKLGRIVFAEARERLALEELVFPWIEKRIDKELANAGIDPNVKFIVLDAAIMLETGWDRVCDQIVFVDASPEIRRHRLAASRGWTAQQVEERENAQWPLNEKRKRAHAILDNSGAPEALARQVQELIEQWGILRNPEGDV